MLIIARIAAGFGAIQVSLSFLSVLNLKTEFDLGPDYTMPVQNENGTILLRFALPFILKRIRIRCKMKTLMKTVRYENDAKRFCVNG